MGTKKEDLKKRIVRITKTDRKETNKQEEEIK